MLKWYQMCGKTEEKSLTRSQLISTVADEMELDAKTVEKVMDCMLDTIGRQLKAGEKVTIAGFGRFEMRPHKTKAFTNPKTKVESRLEPTSIPGFKASGLLKEKLAK